MDLHSCQGLVEGNLRERLLIVLACSSGVSGNVNAVPGIELLEMERNRENSFCCGGGSGNFYTDFFGGGGNSPARIRVREAFQTGASILAVACPVCAIMLDEAVKGEGLEDHIAVKDISELINSNNKPEG